MCFSMGTCPVDPWIFARKVVRKAQDRGKPVAVVVINGLPSIVPSRQMSLADAEKRYPIVGVYDQECLVRYVADDLREYF